VLTRVGSRSSRLHMSQLDGSPRKADRAPHPHKRRACLALNSTTHESALHEGRKPRIVLRGSPRLQSNNCSRDELTSPTARSQQILVPPKVQSDYTCWNIRGKAPNIRSCPPHPPGGGQSPIPFSGSPTTVPTTCSRCQLTMSTPEGRARPQPWGERPRRPRGPPQVYLQHSRQTGG